MLLLTGTSITCAHYVLHSSSVDDDASPAEEEVAEVVDAASEQGDQPKTPRKHIAITRKDRRILSRYLPAFENRGKFDTFFKAIEKLTREEYDAVTTFTKEELEYVDASWTCIHDAHPN